MRWTFGVRVSGKIRSSLTAIKALAIALEAKDPYTQGHSVLVAQYAVLIARELELSQPFIERIQLAGLLHDIGKIGISQSILAKPGELSYQERKEIEAHPALSVRILAPLGLPMEIMLSIRHHHEHYDGTGYPDHLKGEGIPLGARILAVADSFEAMTAARPYRRVLSVEETVAEIERGAGIYFDPRIAGASLRVLGREEATLSEQIERALSPVMAEIIDLHAPAGENVGVPLAPARREEKFALTTE